MIVLKPKKYRFKKKKKNQDIINDNNQKININLEVDLSSNCKITEISDNVDLSISGVDTISNNFKDLSISGVDTISDIDTISNNFKDLSISGVDTISNKINDNINDISITDLLESDKNLIYGNHYIGLLIIHSISMNDLHNLKWINNNKIYLNNTSIFTKKQKYFPLFELDEEIFTEDFKYKKYIRKLLEEEYSIKKKHIINIKFHSTYEKVHNYVVILNDRLNINKEYFWNTRLDFYRLDNNQVPTQKDILSNILNSTEFQLYKNYVFLADVNNKTPSYIKNLEIPYKNLIEILYDL